MNVSHLNRRTTAMFAARHGAVAATKGQPMTTRSPDTVAIANARAEGRAAGIAEALAEGRQDPARAGAAARRDDSNTMLASMERELARQGLPPNRKG